MPSVFVAVIRFHDANCAYAKEAIFESGPLACCHNRRDFGDRFESKQNSNYMRVMMCASDRDAIYVIR